MGRLRNGALAAALLAGGAAGGPCGCLNWRRSYESEIVKCGEGLELYTASKRTNLSRWERLDFSSSFHETCYTVYEKIDSNACLNIQQSPPSTTDWDAGLWCYVPKECSSLNGGHPIISKGFFSSTPRNVSWKVCEPDVDTSLRDLDPPALVARAKAWAANSSSSLDLSGLVRWSWPNLRTHLWSDLEGAYFTGNLTALPLELREAMDKNRSMIVEFSEHRRGDALVIFGSQYWYLKHDPWSCPDTIFCLFCAGGCPEDPAAPAAPTATAEVEPPSKSEEL